MPTNPSKSKRINLTLMYLSILLNTCLIIFLIKQNQELKENATLLTFITKPYLSQIEMYNKNTYPTKKTKIDELIQNSFFCTIKQNTAYKFQFLASGKLKAYLRELTQDKLEGVFPKLPTFIVPYLVTDNAVSWELPLPGNGSSWRLTPYIMEINQSIYFRDHTLIVTQENCQHLSAP